MRCFDYDSVAKEAGIAAKDLDAICTIVRREFPYDEMMFELHVLGICMAIQAGRLTVEQALSEACAA